MAAGSLIGAFIALPRKVVWLRVLVSLPIPLLAAGIAMLLGKP
jgi:hypothetical protein